MRKPDFQLGEYLRRWWVIPRNKLFNIYLHRFNASDGPVLHDHPWINCSIILSGSYREHFADGTSKVRKRGQVVFRGAHTFHRIELLTESVTTLFITGPRYRTWGFLTETGWMDWREHERRGERTYEQGRAT